MSFKTKVKSFLSKLSFYITVPKCVSCGARLDIDDTALCKSCIIEYRNIKRRNCSICAKNLDECLCPNTHLDSHGVHKLIKVYRYVHDNTLPTNKLIYSLKQDNRSDVLNFLAAELEASIRRSLENPEEYIFLNVPRRKSNTNRFGYDHSALLAKNLAKRLGAEYKSILISKSKRDQKKAIGKERLYNVRMLVRNGNISLKGKRVMLVDDIVTTGASMGTAAMLIRGLGAKSIVGCAVSVAYKDAYERFDTSDRFHQKNNLSRRKI